LPLQKPGFRIIRLTPEPRLVTTDHDPLPEEEPLKAKARGEHRRGSRSQLLADG